MRKSLGALILVLVFLGSLAVVCCAEVNREGTEVEIEEKIFYGDKAEAEGLTVTIPVSNGGRLFWKTDYLVGAESGAETDFQFYQNSHYESSGVYSGFELELYSGGGGSVSGGSMDEATYAPYGMGEVFADVASRTNAGEGHSEKVRYGDYYEYYPLSANVTIKGENCVGGYTRAEGNDAAAVRCLTGQYKVPVPEDCMVNVTIYKNSEGGIVGYDYNLENSNTRWLTTFSAVTDEALYYAVDTRTETENGDIAALPGMEEWHGIYRLPYEYVQGTYATYIDAKVEAVECVFPLDPEVVILEMQMSDDQSKLLLFTAEDGLCLLNVIDLATMETVQKLELTACEGRVETYGTIFGENVIVWLLNDRRLAVISEKENGEYALEFAVNWCKEEDGEDVLTYYMDTTRLAVDYNGESLAMVYPVGYYYGDETENTCTFWLTIYNEEGLVYYGEYNASQGIGERYSSQNCLIRNDVNMTVEWGE